MSSHRITSTPIDLVAVASLAAGSTYSLQCSGDFEVHVHLDETGALAANGVRAAAGPRPSRMLPATESRQPGSGTYIAVAGEKLWVWAPGLRSAIAVNKVS